MTTAFCGGHALRAPSSAANALQQRCRRVGASHTARRTRRRGVRMCDDAKMPAPVPEVMVDYDELKSDKDYIVVDGKDVEALIRQMQITGEDALLALEENPEEILEAEKALKEKGAGSGGSDEEAEPVMQYFTADNVGHMPKWARQAFEDGRHQELERGSREVLPETRHQRLHAAVERAGDGVHDFCVGDVAEDYDVPVEFVSDVLIELGIKSPAAGDMIVERLSRAQIEGLLHIITSFDAKDIADRYSDRSLHELADDYDFGVDELLALCGDEGIHLVAGGDTRLQMTREDRVLDILLRDGRRKEPYPSLLDGMVDVKGS